MLALEGGIDVLKPELLTGVDNQLVAEVHRFASSYPCFAPAVYTHTRTYYLAPRGWNLHLSVDQDSFSPIFLHENHKMRAEAETLVQSIKQSMGLLRRHL